MNVSRVIGKVLVLTTALMWVVLIAVTVANLAEGTYEGEIAAAIVGFYGGLFALGLSIPFLGLGALLWVLGARSADPAAGAELRTSGRRPALAKILHLAAFALFGYAALMGLNLLRSVLTSPDRSLLLDPSILAVTLVAAAPAALVVAAGIWLRQKALAVSTQDRLSQS